MSDASTEAVQRLAEQAVEQVVARLPGAEVSAWAGRHTMALTRFAVSTIHQNVAEEVTEVQLVVHHEGRTASSSSTVGSVGGVGSGVGGGGGGAGPLADLVERLARAVALAPADHGWPGVAPAAPATAVPAPDPTTMAAGPGERAAVVRDFVEGAEGLEAAGYCRTTHHVRAVVTSAGQAVAGESAECGLAGIARTPSPSGGMADGVARLMPLAFADLDGHRLGARAAAKARAGAVDGGPVELPPGRYEVVLEPGAVADVLTNLASWGYAGRMVTERRSFVRLGEAQLDPALRLVDDPLAVGLGFDDEGTPTSRLVLVDAGRSVALSHDRRTAAEAGTASTGHASQGLFGAVAAARHLGFVPADPGAAGTGAAGTGAAGAGDGGTGEDGLGGPVGDAATAALVARTERGLLVSDFWYTRVLDSRRLVLTGLTRNGLWMVEDGQVTRPVSNLRFTQSYAEALAPGRVLDVGTVSTPVPGDTYSATSPRLGCPSLRLAEWSFTGNASG